jgi:hypothetical protein
MRVAYVPLALLVSMLLPDHGSRHDAERGKDCVAEPPSGSGLVRVPDADDLCQVEVQLRLH